MATSKKKTTTNTKEKEEASFDLKQALQELPLPQMFKAGLGYYIESKELAPKNQKDFDKIVKDYGELQL